MTTPTSGNAARDAAYANYNWKAYDELQALLVAAFYGDEDLKDLDLSLSRVRRDLGERLLVEQPRSSIKRNEMNEGKILIGGRSENANKEFINGAIQLSDLLNIHEEKAISLLKHAIEHETTSYDRNILEIAVLEYRRERLGVVECIQLLLKGANSADNMPTESRKLFQYHLSQILDDRPSLVSNILKRILEFGTMVVSLRDDNTSSSISKDGNNILTGSALKKTGLSEQLISLHVDSLNSLRASLSELCFKLAKYDRFTPDDTIAVVKHVSAVELTDPTWRLLFSSLLCSIQSLVHSIPDNDAINQSSVTARLAALFALFGGPSAPQWVSTSLQSIAVIQFMITLKYLREFVSRVQDVIGYANESLDSQVEQQLNFAPFQFMANLLLSFKPVTDASQDWPPETDVPMFDTDLQEQILNICHVFVTGFLSTMGRVVRNMKSEAEDTPPTQPQQRIANDNFGGNSEELIQMISPFEALLVLINRIHRHRPDSGLAFWTEPNLIKFIKFMMDVRSVSLLKSGLLVIAALSSGAASAQRASEFLSSDQCRMTWDAFFRSMDMAAKTLAAYPDREIHPDDQSLQQVFLKLLTEVVRYSDSARVSLFSNQSLRAINTLFALLTRRIPVDMKAALFESISAFCVPQIAENGGSSLVIATAVWLQLESANVIPGTESDRSGVSSLTLSSFGGGAHIQKSATRGEGIRYDLDQIESQNQTYPETMAFLALINILICSFKNQETSHDVASSNSGSNPLFTMSRYVDFLADEVFLKSHNRPFTSRLEQWRMIASCLLIFDQCLDSFDSMYVSGRLNDFTFQSSGAANEMSEDMRQMVSHPGFSIIARILSGSPTLKRILQVISYDVEHVNEQSQLFPPFQLAVKLALRIILRSLQLQDFILDLLSLEGRCILRLSGSLTGLDQLLAFYKDVVLNISLFVNCSIDDEICLLAVKILNILSQSPVFNTVDSSSNLRQSKANRMVNLLSSSNESIRILSGFTHRLELDEPELDISDQVAGAGLPSIDLSLPDLIFTNFMTPSKDSPGMANSVRLAILELLVSNLSSQSSFPTVSHYLLGYNLRKVPPHVEIGDSSFSSCLQAVLKLFRSGTEKTKSQSSISESEATQAPIYISHPRLGEKCAQLIYEICSNPSTSSATMRYLRTTEDFFQQQLKEMPGDISSFLSANPASAVSQLHFRAWLLKIIGLELHMTSLSGQRSQTQALLHLLFVSAPSSFRQQFQKGNYEQPLTKMLDCLNSIQIESISNLNGGATSRLLNDPEISKCLVKDGYGQLVYDLRAVHSVLIQRELLFVRQGALSSAQDRSRASAEAVSIMNELLELNQQMAFMSARLHCALSWCQVTRTSFGRCFDALPVNAREEKAYELLAAIFTKLSSQNDVSSDIVEALSFVVLQVMSQMRKDRVYQSVLETSSVSSCSSTGNSSRHVSRGRLPVESLQQVLLKGILDGIVRPDSSLVQRGNFYSALLHYLIYTGGHDELDNTSDHSTLASNKDTNFSDSVAASASPKLTISSLLRGSSLNSSSSVSSAYRASLHVGNVMVVKSYGDRLLETVCRDASDGTGAWPTVAFAVISALYALSSHETPNMILTFMLKRNFLSDFVGSIGLDDQRLQNILRFSDSSEDAMITVTKFEEKMALLLRVSKSKEGSERLIDCGVLDVFIDCKFIDEKPEPSDDPMDYSSAVSIVESYSQVLTSVLRLISSVIVHIGREHNGVLKRASKFVIKHQDAIVDILKTKSSASNDLGQNMTESLVGLLACLATNRTLFDMELHGPGYRTLHNLLITVFAHYSQMQSSLTTGVDGHYICIFSYLLSYLEEATRGDSADYPLSISIGLLFSSHMSKNETSARISPQTFVKMLSSSVDILFFNLNRHKSLRIKSRELDRAPVDDINEIAARAREDFLEELSTSQRQHLAWRHLQKEIKILADDCASVLFIIEHALLILWRYFATVCSDVSASSYSREDAGQVRSLCQDILNKLQSLQLTGEVFSNYQAKNAFIQMLCRKLTTIF